MHLSFGCECLPAPLRCSYGLDFLNTSSVKAVLLTTRASNFPHSRERWPRERQYLVVVNIQDQTVLSPLYPTLLLYVL